MHSLEAIAAIAVPLPQPGDVTPADAYDDALQDALEQRKKLADNLEGAWLAEDHDPLLTVLAAARDRRRRAEAEIRRLIAYGREFTRPRPYRLEDLATAAGMSVSGVRTAYREEDVDAVAETTGLTPRARRAADPPEQTREAR
ncbi:hypothetical protein [Streptomyces megasporus]|uniref:hypothetical protein n=1 Tax=Streptomyces megasporus TaxID=44060 RepID=UPI0004E0EE1A|nr:hypothetical protein [Streptomyces megasporus]